MQRPPELIPPSPWLLRGFNRYCERYLARHFHSVRLLGPPPIVAPERPLVVYLNHAAWWDPLICLLLAQQYFSERANYAPIDAAMLGRYGFMKRLGFFPVEQGTARGAAIFLQSGRAVLTQSSAALWLTPQGRFADPRERPINFAPGLAHLARRMPGAVYLPLALEFPFWSERTPEALAHFGAPAAGADDLAPALIAAQERLAAAAIGRRAADFIPMLKGAAGEGGIYQLWRRLRARWQGQRFRPAHGLEEG